MTSSSLRSIGGSAAAAVPWCCIAPAVLALSGVAVAGASSWIQSAMPLLLVLSVALGLRAFVQSWLLRRGRPWTRWVVTVSLPLLVGLWLFRFDLLF